MMFYSKTTGGFYIPAIHVSMPADIVEITEAEHAALMHAQAEGKVISADVQGQPFAIEPEVAPEQILATFTDAIQKRLDAFARTRNYDGILSACTYATSTVPKFAAEGQYCVTARDATWAKAYEILAEVQAGRPMPASIADIEPELPVLAWPN